MQIRTFSDLIFTILAWGPVLFVLVAICTLLASGVAHLEANSYGSEYVLSNKASVDEFEMKLNRDPAVEQMVG